MRKGQAWSMDLIFGVLIFLLAVGIIYALLVSKGRENIGPLRIESEVIATKIAREPLLDMTSMLADSNQLNQTALGMLADMTKDPARYEELRQQLGVQNEFCIYLQDQDGNLVYILAPDGTKYGGIGSGTGELNLSGEPCGRAMP